ncbi:alpha-glucosidase [Desulfurococcus amylolyticus]|uniref:alpha-glucosidase n=1 Tax=Desulfurococcus amylolyticus TaxID=94694 RepID=UPI0023F1500D|nr:alpha-glucosidase [Desulfurococcus amylolyticus]
MESVKLLRDALNTLETLLSLKQLSDPRLKRKIEEAIESLELTLREISVNNIELARFISDKTRETVSKISVSKELTREIIEDLEKLVKWCKTIPYDFTDRIKYVRKGYRYYLYGMMLFFVLAGTYTQIYAVSALLIALPSLMAMYFMRRRRSMGLMLAYASTPLPLAIFSWMIGYVARALLDPGEINYLAGVYGLPVETVYMILLLYLVGSLAGLLFLSIAIYILYKNRGAFI